MKKIISLLLCAIIVALSMIPSFAAQKNDDTPTILVPGFLQSYMYVEDESGEKENLFPPEAKNIIVRIFQDIHNFIPALVGALFGDLETFGYTLGTGIYPVAGALACNPDGSSVNDIKHYSNEPAESNAVSVIEQFENGERDIIQFEDLINYVDDNNIADISNLYVFEYDSRMDSIELAEELREYIKAVKGYTGADKVNIFTVSYGGLIASTYLYYYMNDCDVDKLVMSDPALGGTNFPTQVFSGSIELPVSTLVDFVEYVLGSGSEIYKLLENAELDGLDVLMNAATSAMAEIMVNWGSVWTLCTPELYTEYKAELLDPVKNAKIIERNDIIHYEIMPSMHRTFKKAMSLGSEISIIAGMGNSICLGGDEFNSDILLPTEGTTGAVCADVGKRFEDGYKAVGTTCNNPEHNHVSPSMTVDASSAYLPENTWFFDGHYHAMYYTEEHNISLICKLLFTDEIKDVYSDPSYPQFRYSDNPHNGVYIQFNSSKSGYLSDADTALSVTNLYKRSAVKVLSVSCNGVELDFDSFASKIILPNESTEISFSGDIPDVTAKGAVITVEYIKIGIPFSVSKAEFGIMVDNA